MSIKVDAMDEHILLALREGPQGLQSLTSLANINYNTLRQRIDKLSRYGYLAKPGYGKYNLTDKGRRFVDELSSPVAPDFDDPGLKKLIDMLPSELHRSFFRLAISGVIAKYLLFEVYDDGYPGFIMGGRTRGFKTALGNVICRIFGLSPEKNIYPLYLATPGEFGVRRFRSKEAKGFDISESPYFNESFMVFDEFDKVSDKNIRRNVLFSLTAVRNLMLKKRRFRITLVVWSH
jgi:predicted transcriptional regulator